MPDLERMLELVTEALDEAGVAGGARSKFVSILKGKLNTEMDNSSDDDEEEDDDDKEESKGGYVDAVKKCK